MNVSWLYRFVAVLSSLYGMALPSLYDGVCDDSFDLSEADLLAYLFKNYSKAARPRRKAWYPVEVTLSLRVYGIHDLIERENLLAINGYLFAYWQDEFLVWNDTFPYNCISNVQVPSATTWLPDIAISNSPSGMYSLLLAPGFTVEIASDGTVTHAPGAKIITTCDIDVTYFPFDKQLCRLHFESWNYDITMQTLKIDPNYPFVKVISGWCENQQWAIESNKTILVDNSYFDNYRYHHMIYSLVLVRKSLFYYINIIVPSIVISLAEMATFVLPLEEVLKIHISFTCLLAYSVFQGMVIDDLPRSGVHAPMMSVYIDLQMTYIAFIALLGDASIFMLIRQANMRKHKPPPWMFSIALKLGHLILIKLEEHPTSQKNESKRALAKASFRAIEAISHPGPLSGLEHGKSSKKVLPTTCLYYIDDVTTHSHGFRAEMDPEEIHDQWHFIARVTSRVIGIAYSTAITVTPCVMFYSIPKEGRSPLANARSL